MRAFPTARVFRDQVIPTGGMLLRDYFAAKALQGYLSSPATHRALNEEEVTQKIVVETCYGWADAMMKARGPDE
jgi:hypothetical protein